MEKLKATTLAKSERISGILLIISFFLAVFVANVNQLSDLYIKFVHFNVSFGYGSYTYHTPFISLVNDGLMTFFFLLIGLELKGHLVYGELSQRNSLILPTAAALGGIIAPALIYLYFNWGTLTVRGWAIPIATDTAFMLGILSFFGKIISAKLRAFIIGFSLIDDALALLILAIFYSKSTAIAPVIATVIFILFLLLLNRAKIVESFYYLIIGVALWVAMVQSGIHGTLSGVILAMAIPVKVNGKLNPSFHGLENTLRPIVYYIILPIFAFVNSGVNLEMFTKDILTSNITLGIIFGLFIGKQLGIFGFSFAVVKQKWCPLPDDVTWLQFYAVSILGGIGFTLSLFIGDLTFEMDLLNYAMRAGVIVGSLLSAIMGTLILIYITYNKKIVKRQYNKKLEL